MDKADELCTIFNQAAVVTCSLFAALQCQLLQLLPEISSTKSSVILDSFLRIFSYSGVILNGAAALYSLMSLRFALDEVQRARSKRMPSLSNPRTTEGELAASDDPKILNKEAGSYTPNGPGSDTGSMSSSPLKTIYTMSEVWMSFSFIGGFWCFFIQITLLLWVREGLVVSVLLTVLVFIALLPMLWTFVSQNLQGRTVLMRRNHVRSEQSSPV
ncbi:hypothetical protein FRC03_000779 [Tulasnella sp. 419]|nr:hypothetical protein FRC03_000779 [Tulasnella sp. 419]